MRLLLLSELEFLPLLVILELGRELVLVRLLVEFVYVSMLLEPASELQLVMVVLFKVVLLVLMVVFAGGVVVADGGVVAGVHVVVAASAGRVAAGRVEGVVEVRGPAGGPAGGGPGGTAGSCWSGWRSLSRTRVSLLPSGRSCPYPPMHGERRSSPTLGELVRAGRSRRRGCCC